jgi:hypothetical protein
MARPLTRYGRDNGAAVFDLHGVGRAHLCARHSTRIWGWGVRVWVGTGAPVGVRTTATMSSPPFSSLARVGGRGGVLWAIRGE